MPKGVQNINPELVERLRTKVAQSLSFSLNTNKNYDLLSTIIYKRTGAMLSNSTLRRVFQYKCGNHPTKSTLDLISKAIGFHDWDDFTKKERNHQHTDLFQLIAMFKLQGLGNLDETRQILENHSHHPDFFNLLNATVQIAITNRDIGFLSNLFEMEGVFNRSPDSMQVFYFVQSLVISLNQSELMPGLIEYYGSSPKAHTHLVEYYVDEDNLNGYYFKLLQVYHHHKTTPEALLFYNCMMYQHAAENNLPTRPWLDFLSQFSDESHIHHIPKARRLAILMLEANGSEKIKEEMLNKTRDLFLDLSDDDKVDAALFMVKLLFMKRELQLIEKVLLLTPNLSAHDRPVDDRNNINQIKIYRAYVLYNGKKKTEALLKLNEFDPLMVHAFFYNHIMNDFRVISNLILNK